MASALPMAREASGCSNSARDACVAVALGRAHQEPAPSHGSPLTTSHAPCGRGQNPAPQSPRRCPAPQILLPCFRRSLWLQKSHADARKPHFLSRSSRVTARSAGDADTKRQSAGLCAGWRRGGGGQQPPSEGTACSVGFTPGDTYVYYVPQGSCDGGLLPSVHCRWFRTQPWAVRGQMRPCAVRV